MSAKNHFAALNAAAAGGKPKGPPSPQTIFVNPALREKAGFAPGPAAMMSPKPKAAADSELSLAASAAGFSPEQAAVVVTAMFQHDLNCDSPAEVIAVMQRLAASDMLDIVVGGDKKSKKSQHLSEEVVAVMAGRAPAPTPRSKMLITGSSSSTEAVDATAIHVAAAAMVRPSYASLASQPASRAGSRAGSRRNSKDTAGDHAESGGASAAAHSQALETIAQLPSLRAVFTSLSRWVQSQAHSGGSIDALVNSKALQLLFANVMRQQQASAAAVDDGDCESDLASCLTTIIGCGIDGGSGASAASAAGASLAKHAVSIGRTLCALHSSSTISSDSSSAGASAVDALTTSLALRCAELLVGYRQAIASPSISGTNGGVSPSAGSKGSTSSEASEAASLISKAAAASAAADAANASGKIDLRSLLAAREAASAAMGAALNVVQSKSASAASPPAASVAAPTATVAPVNASMALSEAAAGSAVAVAECLARLASTSSAPSAASGGRTGAGARAGAGASSSSLALARAAEASARTTVAVITKEIGLVLQPLKERYNDAATQVQTLNDKREQLLAALAAVDNEIVVASAKASEIETSIRDVTAAYAPRLLAAKETLDRASAALVSADAVPVIQSACETLQRDLTASLQVAIDSAKPQAAAAKPVVLAVAEEEITHTSRMSWLQTAALYAQQESKLINAVVSRASSARAEAAKQREGAAQLKALSVFEHLVAQAEEKADQLDAEADEDEGTAEQLRSAATRSLLGFVVVVAPMLSSLAPAELVLVHDIRSHATAAGLEAVGEAGWRLPPLPAGVAAGHASAGVAVASPPATAASAASSVTQARAKQTPTGKQQAAAAPAPAASGKPPTAPKAAPAAAAPAPVVNAWGKPRPAPAPAAVTAAVDPSGAVIEPSAHASSAAAAASAAASVAVAVAGPAAPSSSSSSWGDQALAAEHSASSVPAAAAAAAAGAEVVVHVVDPQAQAQVASLAALTSPSSSSAASPSSTSAPLPQRDRKRAGGKRQA